MLWESPIDRAICLVDDEARTHGFLRRTPDWGHLGRGENDRHMRRGDGYSGHFCDGGSRACCYRPERG